jgi:hypothetical protein
VKIGADDQTLIHKPDDEDGQYITVRELFEQGRAIVTFIDAFQRYLVVFHNGQMLTGFEAKEEVFDEFGDEEAPMALWKVGLSIAAAVLVSQVALYFLVQLTGWQSMWWRPLLATTIAVPILLVI